MGLKAILVDDDRHALEILEYHLNSYPEIEIQGCFTDPVKALKTIGTQAPDAVFLDIDMPGVTGTDTAARIGKATQGTAVVFVTSHREYALEAFDLNALDYLVKPLSKKRLAKTIQRLIDHLGSGKEGQGDGNLEISSLGRFEIKWKKEPALKWRSSSTKELAAFLIHHEGRNISRDYILEHLWPGENVRTAANRLYTGIHYIRKAFETYRITRGMIEINGKYCIRFGPGLKTDASRFKQAVSSVDADTGTLEAAEALYTGEYLGGEAWLWAYPERERLNRTYIDLIVRLAEKYMAESAYEKAEAILLKAFEQNPYEGRITFRLLQVYKENNQKAKAARHFSTYETLLAEELGIDPEQDIRTLFISIN